MTLKQNKYRLSFVTAVLVALVILIVPPTPARAESEPFVGQIMMFAGNFNPRGWAFCDGQLLAVSQNDALFSLIGTIYGGDGRTTFALPDLRGRIPMHAGNGPGLSSRRLGQKGGAERVTLTANQMPSHTHGVMADKDQGREQSPGSHVLSYDRRSGQYSTRAPDVPMSAGAVLNSGGNQSHNNMPPYLAVNYCISMYGVYPSRH